MFIRVVRTIGWIWVGFSVVVLIAFGSLRILDMFGAGPADPFGVRYAEHPLVALAHLAPGVLFLVLAPLQFISRIRRRHLPFHRGNGRVLVVLATLSGVFALVAAFLFPAFGGLPTQLATVVFGVWFLGALWKAIWHVRRREFAAHREWMIRVFALALGVATIRAVIAVAQALTGGTMEDVFGLAFWVGFGLNALVAEAWIRYTRRPARRPSGPDLRPDVEQLREERQVEGLLQEPHAG